MRMTTHHDIANALGMKLWTTDWFIPQYRPGKIGNWKILSGGQLVHDWGYHSGVCLVEMLPALARKADTKSGRGVFWETWMSLTPHEIESQELACRHAYGQTVVMGLGMGWVAANIAMNAKVTQTTVIERDLEVIELFRQSGALDSLPETARRKIVIRHANALKWRPSFSKPINFLYADIWLRLAQPSTLNQVKQMQRNVQAETIYYWGQEITIYNALKQADDSGSNITMAAIKAAVDNTIQLPLLIPDQCDYPMLIEQVINNRIQRNLPIK